MFVAAIGVRALLRIAPSDLPRLESVPIDARVLLFALGVTVLTGALVGLVPALRLARHPLRTLMNEEGRGVSSGRAQRRLFGGLIVAEIALALLLLIGAGLLTRTYANLTAVNPGFDHRRLLTFFIYVPGRVEMTFEQGRPVRASYLPMAIFFRQLEERVRVLSGVAAVATTTSMPLNKVQYDPLSGFQLRGLPGGNADETASLARSRCVSPGFFDTMQIRLLAGRGFLPSERQDSPGVAVVNETFARRFFPGQNPLGQRIRYRGEPFDAGGCGVSAVASSRG